MANPSVDLVCVVDDDPSVLKAVVRSLSLSGWRVKEFSNPREFLSYVKAHGAAVAVIDVWMPIMNGLEVQSLLRDLSPSTRVIIVTAKDDSDTRCIALGAGASAFLTKPLDGEELLNAVESAFASA